MKLLILSLMMIGNFAQATMLECKTRGEYATNEVLHIQFDGESLDHPANASGMWIDGDQTAPLVYNNDTYHTDIFFLENVRAKKVYSVGKGRARGTYQVSCTEPKALGMMLPCTKGSEFFCKKVKNF